jgi:hypothetical protein
MKPLGAAALGSAAWLVSAPVRGVEPPRTALSHSVQAAVEVIADPANAFRFPQLAARESPSVATYAATSTRADAAVVARFEGHRLFHRFRHFPDASLSRSAWRPFGRESHARHQTGWAARFRGARVGLAYAWSTVGGRDRLERPGFGPTAERVVTEFETVDVREGSLGFGWGEDASVDLVLDVVWDRLKYKYTRRESYDTAQVAFFDSTDLLARLDHRLGGAARVVLPVGARGGLTLHGSFQDATLVFERNQLSYTISQGQTTYRGRLQEERAEHGVEWSVAGRVETAQGHLPTWGLTGRFSSQRGPWRSAGFPYLVERVWSRAETSEVGISHARPGPFGTELRSGFSVRRTRSETTLEDASVLEELFSPVGTTRERDDRTRVSSTFAWGLRRTMGTIDFVSSLSTNLDPLSLFALVDATISF